MSSRGRQIKLNLLEPPPVYSIIERGIYRSCLANEANIRFLSRLQLRSLVFLVPERLPKCMRSFVHDNKVELRHQGLRSWQPDLTWQPVNEQLVKEALEFVLDVSNHPVMIMCPSGVSEAGVVLGCLRRMQRWAMSSVIDEYRRNAKHRASLVHEQFIELFDLDLVTMPKQLPQWLEFEQHMWDAELRKAKADRRARRRSKKVKQYCDSEQQMATKLHAVISPPHTQHSLKQEEAIQPEDTIEQEQQAEPVDCATVAAAASVDDNEIAGPGTAEVADMESNGDLYALADIVNNLEICALITDHASFNDKSLVEVDD
jgi:Tyrosine phosphatase family